MAENYIRQFDMTGTTTGTSLSDIGDEIVLGQENGFTKMAFEVYNGATQFTNFALLGKAHRDGGFVILLSNTDWDTVAGILKHKVGTIKTLAATTRAFAYVELGPLYSIKFQAAVASSTTTPLIKGGFIV